MSAERHPVAERFGANLRVYRLSGRISQESLGELCGLHRTEIGLLERGTRVPRIDTLIKLSSALAIPPAKLLEGIRWRPSTVEPGGFEFTAPVDAPAHLAALDEPKGKSRKTG